MPEEKINLSAEVVARVTARLIELLNDALEDNPEAAAKLVELVPQFVSYAAKYGAKAIDELLANITGDNTEARSAGWVSLINSAATIKEQLAIAEATRQATIMESLKKLQQKKDDWEDFKNFLKAVGVVISLIAIL